MFDVQVIRRNARKYPQIVQEAAEEFLPGAGQAVLAEAKRRVPVVTGNLRGSLASRIEGNSAIVGTNVDYAQHVEYGTKRSKHVDEYGTKGRPYLRPAIDVLRRKLLSMFGKIVARKIRGRS